jgi:hypothetical protein
MKWFAKFKISSALDDGRPTADLSALAGPNAELHDFAGALLEVDRRLRAERPAGEAPPFLHGSIMAAVAGATAPAAHRQPRSLWWRTVGVAAVLVACCFLAGKHFMGLVRSPASSGPNLQQQVAALPATVLSPLSTELEKLNLDLEQTTSFLLASVPQLGN